MSNSDNNQDDNFYSDRSLHPKLSPVSHEDHDASLFTFYSFKGGVGRTMALLNTAAILAGRGFRVLMMDLDLEAPGLSYLEHESNGDKDIPGFVDLLYDVTTKGQEAPLACENSAEAIKPYLHTISVPDEVRKFDDGVLYIMPAGMLDKNYERRRLELDLPRLYREGRGQPLIQLLKQRIIESRMFDYVLIDSRTGFSDESGICIRDLADRLMVVMGLNRQNVQGTSRFLRRMQASHIKPQSIDIILSPVPIGEDELYDQRKQAADQELSDIYSDIKLIDLEIPYHPRLALSEEPYVFRRRQGGLYEAYSRIEARTRKRCGDGGSQLDKKTNEAIRSREYKKARSLIARRARMSPERAIMLLRRAVYEIIEEPEGVSQFYDLWTELAPNDSEPYWTYARALYKSKIDFDFAESLFKKALDVDPEDINCIHLYAIFLMDIRENYTEAEKFYCQALRVRPNDPIILGNYAQILFLMERWEEGKDSLSQAISKESLPKALLVELWFYAYAHQIDLGEEPPLQKLAELLEKGTRSPHWPLEKNVDKAIDDGHPEPEFLKNLARVISRGESIESLKNFDVWNRVITQGVV